MATKPLTLPRPWATNGTYATGPYVGSTNKADPGVGIAAEGHRPGAADATAAEHENFQQNQVTAVWVPWVNSGTSLGGAQASIVERDALGKFAVTGFDVAGVATSSAITLTAPNVSFPLLLATSTGGGTIFQTTQMGTSTSYNVVMSGAASGQGFSCTATATSTGACHHAAIPVGSDSMGIHIENAGDGYSLLVNSTKVNGLGSLITSEQGPCLTLTANGVFATTLVMTPRTGSAVISGAFWLELVGQRSPKYYDSNLVERTFWATNGGISVDSNITTGPTTIAVANDAVTRTYAFIAGNKYEVTMGIEMGMGAGIAASSALLTCTVGGVALAYSGYTLRMWHTGIGTTTERGWCKTAIFTAGVTGNLAVTLRVTPSASINYEQAFVNIVGHYL